MKRYIHAASALDKPYRGIWYGAKTNSISIKELLDKIIQRDGAGFTIFCKRHYVGNNLLDEGVLEVYLMDEEHRGKLKLDSESIQYLKNNLDENNWIRLQLIKWTEEGK